MSKVWIQTSRSLSTPPFAYRCWSKVGHIFNSRAHTESSGEKVYPPNQKSTEITQLFFLQNRLRAHVLTWWFCEGAGVKMASDFWSTPVVRSAFRKAPAVRIPLFFVEKKRCYSARKIMQFFRQFWKCKQQACTFLVRESVVSLWFSILASEMAREL